VTSLDDATLIALATATADRLVERASERGVTSPNERDYLQPSCLDAARALAVESVSRGIDLQVRTNLRMRSDDWPRSGAVDIALTADQKTTAVDLKAGTGRHALVACAWDAVKLSFALQLDLVSSAYVLALAPTDDWADARGGEFSGRRRLKQRRCVTSSRTAGSCGNAMASRLDGADHDCRSGLGDTGGRCPPQ